MIRNLSALGAVFFAAVALVACGGGIPGNGVARVGDMVITKPQFDHWLTIANSSSAGAVPGQARPPLPDPPGFTNCAAYLQRTTPQPAKGQPAVTPTQFKAQCQQQYNTLRDQVMQFLITSNWVLGEASDQSVSVTNSAVSKQLNTITAQQFPKAGDFQKFLQQSGETIPDLMFRVRLNLLSDKIRTKVTKAKSKVSDAQIANYYNQNKSRFATPEKRDLRIILTKTQAQANKALASIKHGQSFASVARRVSIDTASKAQGGVLLGVIRGQQEAALDAAIFAAPPHKLSGPVKTPFGFYVFQVQKDTPASQQPLSQARLTIQQLLTSMNQQKALDTFVKKFQSKWRGRTTCRTNPTFVVATDCGNVPKPKPVSTPPTQVPQTQTPQTRTTPGSGRAP
jgi:foldase protein PrsA